MPIKITFLIVVIVLLQGCQRGEETRSQVYIYGVLLESYMWKNKDFWDESLENIQGKMITDKHYKNKILENCPMFNNNKDEWGNEFVYEKTKNEIKIISKGPNKIYDKGKKDDIIYNFKRE